MAVGDAEDVASRIPVIGGLIGAESDASRDLQKQLQQMQQMYQQYRGQTASMRNAQLGHQLSAWDPVNDYVAQMTGTQPIDTELMRQQFREYGSNLGYEPPKPLNPWQQMMRQIEDKVAQPNPGLFGELNARLAAPQPGPGQAAFGKSPIMGKFRSGR